MTGREDAVYCYNTEGRGQCYAFEGQKVALHWYRSYLVVASTDTNQSGGSSKDLEVEKNILTVFDVQNKFIAYTAPVKPIKAVVSNLFFYFPLKIVKLVTFTDLRVGAIVCNFYG